MSNLTNPWGYPGCTDHWRFDCGCEGWPSTQQKLRESCANSCKLKNAVTHCVGCSAASHIDSLERRLAATERLLEKHENALTAHMQALGIEPLPEL